MFVYQFTNSHKLLGNHGLAVVDSKIYVKALHCKQQQLSSIDAIKCHIDAEVEGCAKHFFFCSGPAKAHPTDFVDWCPGTYFLDVYSDIDISVDKKLNAAQNVLCSSLSPTNLMYLNRGRWMYDGYSCCVMLNNLQEGV